MTPIHPELAAHGSFAHLRLGRKPPRPGRRALQLARYLDPAALPAAPSSVDYASAVPGFPMYGNNSLGDCTCAAVGHMIQAWTAAAGDPRTPAESDIETLYWETGYPPASSGSPGCATDDGRDEQSVLDYWRQNGVAGDTITAYGAVDVSNADQVKLATYLFGGLYIGVELPLTAQGQAVWDVVPADPEENEPGSWGGHAVPILAYDGGSYTVVTWGATLKMTAAFFDEYVDEAYAIVTPDWLNSAGSSPDGFDLERLEADLAELTQQ